MQTTLLSQVVSPERIHPSLWRATQLSRTPGRHLDTGFPALSAELPGGGWPLGHLVDILILQPGIGELQLLRPALACLSRRPVALVQPPHPPQATAWSNWGCPTSKLIWIRPHKVADALWATEQILRSNTFGAVLLWQTAVRGPVLRRLQLAAQESDTLFALVRPLGAGQQASPAPLRLALQPAPQGLNITILKRRGGSSHEPIVLDLHAHFAQPGHAILDSRAPVAPQSGHPVPELAH